MKLTKDMSKKFLSAILLLGTSVILKAAAPSVEPNFKLKNNLMKSIWYGVASTEGALNKKAFEGKLEQLSLGSEAKLLVDNARKKVFLLVMESPKASHGILYELPQDKTLWIVISSDRRGNLTLAPQKRSWMIRDRKQRSLWDNNVKDADIREKPFELHRYRSN
jgi:hypothetical protein